jgi:Mn-dependent DtxR family transcriptional regulator
MKPAEITKDEWLAELERLGLGSADVDGFTAAELAERIGVCVKTAREKVGRGIAAGLIEFAGYRQATRIDGKPTPIPVYRRKRNKRNAR